jgi:hypothetical protein
MKIFRIGLLILITIIDIGLFIWESRLSNKVFLGQITSVHKQLRISILSGITVGLLFIIIAMIAGISDVNSDWTITGIAGVAIIASVLFVLGTIGTIWRFFIAGKFRARLFSKVKSMGKAGRD